MTRYVTGEITAADGGTYATVYRSVPNPDNEGDDYGWLEQLSREELAVLLYRLTRGHERCNTETDYCYVCNCHPSHGHASDCPLHNE